jgi:indole-3-glycerol phosphate synthase
VQLFVARGHGADAVLLMVSVLGDSVAEYADVATTLGLQALVEVVDEAELEVALAAGAGVIAVNSRDLHTLEVDSARARRVVRLAADHGAIVVAASGTSSRADVVAHAEAGAHAVLVGTALMRATYPEDVLEELTGVARAAPVSS